MASRGHSAYTSAGGKATVHDLILSKPGVRDKVFNDLLEWLRRVGGAP
jgi:hypothetical protein